MRLRNRLLSAALGLSAAVTLTVVPLAAGPAVAQLPPNIHWGQSPFYPTCLEGPCRVVIIADKTADATYEAQVQRWAAWMNFVRTNYNLKLPAFGYVGPAQGLQPDPGCAVANGIISVCRNDAVVDADCSNPGPSTIRCTTFNVTLGDQHILWAKSAFRTQALQAADVWTVVCAALGRSIGIPPSSDTNSCLHNNLTLGTGQEKYYVGSDWVALFNLYDHPAGS
jgi:hypothetical protein